MGHIRISFTCHGVEMNLEQVKEFVRNQTKNYRVSDILDEFDAKEWYALYNQINAYKPYETERRLIDYARMELDQFRYVLYTERHYEDLLLDKACIECLRYEDQTLNERRYYVRRPRS